MDWVFSPDCIKTVWNPVNPGVPYSQTTPYVILAYPGQGKKEWRSFNYGSATYSYHPRAIMPTVDSHPYTVMVRDEDLTYEGLRQYCKDELCLGFRDVAIARRAVSVYRNGGTHRVNEGFVLHFRDHVPAIQFKLRWNGLDDDTEKRHGRT